MKRIPFKAEFVPLILSGTKRHTSRWGKTPERDPITLLEPTARYTDRLSDFLRDFVIEDAPTMAELEAAGQQSIFGDES